MIVYAVFVLTENGRVILSEQFQSIEGVPDDLLMGGVLTAISSMNAGTTERYADINSVEVEGLSYHIRSFGLIRIVLVTSTPRSPEEIIQIVGFRFINEYSDVLMRTDYTMNVFDTFKKTIREIVPETVISDESKTVEPTIKLGTGEIFGLPLRLQKTALAMVSLRTGTLQEIVHESGNSISDIEQDLDTLQKMGFVGIKQINGKTTYYCSTKI